MWQQELAAALEAAREAGRVALAWSGRSDLPASRKPDGSIVTQADLDANESIIRFLKHRFPADACLTEEGPDDPARVGTARCWIADPIDGTSSFAAGRQAWAVLVALVVDGSPVVGVVHYPAEDRLWAAVQGGAVMTGSGNGPLAPLSVPDRPAALRLRYGRSVAERIGHLEGEPLIEAVGLQAGTMDLIHLVTGTADAFVTVRTGASEWDVAATDTLIRAGGGIVTDLSGADLTYNRRPEVKLDRGIIAASSRAGHARVKELLGFTGTVAG